MSAPATNAFSPAPVMMTVRTLSSWRISNTAARNSSMVAAFKALRRSGRLIVMVATASLRVTNRCVGVMSTVDSTLAPPDQGCRQPRRHHPGSRADRISGEVVHVGRASRHEQLVQFVAGTKRGCEPDCGETRPGSDAGPLSPCQPTQHHQPETAVGGTMPGLVADPAGNRRTVHRRHEKDAGGIEHDRQPEPEPARGQPGTHGLHGHAHQVEGRWTRWGTDTSTIRAGRRWQRSHRRPCRRTAAARAAHPAAASQTRARRGRRTPGGGADGCSSRPHFRPSAISHASVTTSRLSRPATIRKAFPYSYVGATTVPAPAARLRARKYGTPIPTSAIAARATSGWLISNGNNRPCSNRPIANISGSVIRNTSPLARRPNHKCPAPGTAHAARQIRYGFTVCTRSTVAS